MGEGNFIAKYKDIELTNTQVIQHNNSGKKIMLLSKIDNLEMKREPIRAIMVFFLICFVFGICFMFLSGGKLNAHGVVLVAVGLISLITYFIVKKTKLVISSGRTDIVTSSFSKSAINDFLDKVDTLKSKS